MSKSEIDNDRGEVFTYLMNCRSQVKLSTFYLVRGIVDHNYVVIHDAPPRVVSEIVRQFKCVSMRPEGLLIPLAKDNG
jgi:hypothetical protein